MSEAPPYYTWVIQGKLAALAFPSSPSHLQFLANDGITTLISLTAESTPPVDKVTGLQLVKIRMVDFSVPSVKQIEEFIDVVNRTNQNGGAAAVHCAQGRGRTGTLIACYFVREHGMNSVEAIAEIRKLRPGSIETRGQEQAVHNYYKHSSGQM